MASPTERPAPLDKAYEPHAIEIRLYQTWEQAGAFRPSGQGPSYCIMIPPPNVTGSLHMGHAFKTRSWTRSSAGSACAAHNTLWQAGTDHAGIATQMVVERQLDAEGQTRHDLGREAFVERVWDWKARVWRQHHPPVATHGRLARLVARAFHHGLGDVRGRDRSVRQAL